MELSFADRVQRVKEILQTKALRKACGKRLTHHMQKELAELLVVSEVTAYGLSQRGLSREERAYVSLFSIENTYPKQSLESEILLDLYQQQAAERQKTD
jgi:hypothetical protein